MVGVAGRGVEPRSVGNGDVIVSIDLAEIAWQGFRSPVFEQSSDPTCTGTSTTLTFNFKYSLRVAHGALPRVYKYQIYCILARTEAGTIANGLQGTSNYTSVYVQGLRV